MKTKQSYLTITCSVLVILLLLLCACASGPVKTEFGEPKSTLFSASKTLMDLAASKRADEFAPHAYTKAVSEYTRAEQDFEKGQSLTIIQNRLKKADQFAQQSIDLADTMQMKFSDLIKSRDDAITAGAQRMDLEPYERGNKLFLRTISSVEKAGMEEARMNAQKSIAEFRKAELMAVKENMVGDLNAQLMEAEKFGANELAPESYSTAIKYRNASLRTLEQDRYNEIAAKEEVEKGKYYTRKAMFIANRIKKGEEGTESWEQMFLAREKELTSIGTHLGVTSDFDEGFERPVAEINQAILQVKAKETGLREQEQAYQMRLREAEEDKLKMRSELQTTEGALRQQKTKTEKVRKIRALFTVEEANVAVDPSDNINITLFGLNFDSSKSSLKPEHYPLLAKVNEAIELFPHRNLRISGHTDSVGDALFNEKLSLERAKSVAFFIEKAMGGAASRIDVIGFGSKQPIAPNTTAEGRKQNRRIDVTLLAPAD
jgi:OOP family OmpA-OmpF porin